VLKAKERFDVKLEDKILTSDEPAIVNFKRPRSSELIFVVDIDKTFSNRAILVNYLQKK